MMIQQLLQGKSVVKIIHNVDLLQLKKEIDLLKKNSGQSLDLLRKLLMKYGEISKK